MSASIYYQPVKGKYLSIGAPSGFLDLLERLGFKRGNCFITDQDYFKLQAAAAGTENNNYREILQELADAAHKHGEIRLWAEY